MRDQMNTVTFNNSRAIKSIKSFKIIEEYFSYRKSFNYDKFPKNFCTKIETSPSSFQEICSSIHSSLLLLPLPFLK